MPIVTKIHLPPVWVDRIAEVTRDSYPTDPKPKVVRRIDWVSGFLCVAAGYVLGSLNNDLWLRLLEWWRTNP
jgi:hypothetical protein